MARPTPLACTGGDPTACTGGDPTACTGGDPTACTGGDPTACTGGDPTACTGGDPTACTGGDPTACTGGDPTACTGGDPTACTGGDPTRLPPNCNSAMLTVWKELWHSLPRSGRVSVTVNALLQHYKEWCRAEKKWQRDTSESPPALLPVSFTLAKDWLLKIGSKRPNLKLCRQMR